MEYSRSIQLERLTSQIQEEMAKAIEGTTGSNVEDLARLWAKDMASKMDGVPSYVMAVVTGNKILVFVETLRPDQDDSMECAVDTLTEQTGFPLTWKDLDQNGFYTIPVKAFYSIGEGDMTDSEDAFIQNINVKLVPLEGDWPEGVEWSSLKQVEIKKRN